jgi:hypothetical protein
LKGSSKWDTRSPNIVLFWSKKLVIPKNFTL